MSYLVPTRFVWIHGGHQVTHLLFIYSYLILIFKYINKLNRKEIKYKISIILSFASSFFFSYFRENLKQLN